MGRTYTTNNFAAYTARADNIIESSKALFLLVNLPLSVHIDFFLKIQLTYFYTMVLFLQNILVTA